MLLHNDTLSVGRELLVELTLNGTIFSLPAVVCRLERRDRSDPNLCAVQYLDMDTRQQDRMAKAIVQLQLKLLSLRVTVE